MKLKNIAIIGKSKLNKRKFIDNLIVEFNNVYRIKRDCNDLKSYASFEKKTNYMNLIGKQTHLIHHFQI